MVMTRAWGKGSSPFEGWSFPICLPLEWQQHLGRRHSWGTFGVPDSQVNFS